MDLREVLLYALNHQAVTGCDFSKRALSKKVIKLFEENGVDIDDVVREIEENKDGHLDLY